MKRDFDTIVIGGGQARLSVSYHLALRQQDHIVLEQTSEAEEACSGPHRYHDLHGGENEIL